jgi:hypothetical protein
MDGYEAGGPAEGREKLPSVTANAVSLTRRHCVWLLFHSFVWTTYSLPRTLTLSNCPQWVAPPCADEGAWMEGDSTQAVGDDNARTHRPLRTIMPYW